MSDQPDDEVRPDQFDRVLAAVRELDACYAQFLEGKQPFDPDRFERATIEMKRLEVLVADGQRCIEIARGLQRAEAQRCLDEASFYVEEAQMWFAKVPIIGGTPAGARFHGQRCINEATLKVELAQFWLTRALSFASGKR